MRLARYFGVPGKENGMEMERKSKLKSIIVAALLTIGLVVVLAGGIVSAGAISPAPGPRVYTATATPGQAVGIYIQHLISMLEWASVCFATFGLGHFSGL